MSPVMLLTLASFTRNHDGSSLWTKCGSAMCSCEGGGIQLSERETLLIFCVMIHSNKSVNSRSAS